MSTPKEYVKKMLSPGDFKIVEENYINATKNVLTIDNEIKILFI